jgi:Protein of unknown function (DUF3085)
MLNVQPYSRVRLDFAAADQRRVRMSRVIFAAADVRRVVEHALSAKRWQERVIGYDTNWEPVTEPGEPSVIFVHDEGVYLCSNGLPRDIVSGDDGKGGGRSFVAYAHGCNPHTDVYWYDTPRALVGGDDFGETLPWAQEIKDALDAGATEIILALNGETIELQSQTPRSKRNGN